MSAATIPLPGPVLVINAGSSSLKFSVFTALAEHPRVHGVLEELHTITDCP